MKKLQRPTKLFYLHSKKFEFHKNYSLFFVFKWNNFQIWTRVRTWNRTFILPGLMIWLSFFSVHDWTREVQWNVAECIKLALPYKMRCDVMHACCILWEVTCGPGWHQSPQHIHTLITYFLFCTHQQILECTCAPWSNIVVINRQCIMSWSIILFKMVICLC